MSNWDQFGPEIKKLRGDKPIKFVAELAGIDRGHLSRLENSKSRPTEDTIELLARALDASKDRLLVLAGYLPSAYVEFEHQWDEMNIENMFSELKIIGFKDFVDKYGIDALGILTGKVQHGEPLPKNEQHLWEIINSIKDLSPNQLEPLSQFIKSMTEKAAAKEPAVLKVAESPNRYGEPIAASRTGNPMDDTPDDIIQDVEDAKRDYLEEMRLEKLNKKK